jgi:hypothetical protein
MKYVFLYNLFDDDLDDELNYFEKQMVEDIKKVIPEALILDESRFTYPQEAKKYGFKDEITEGKSIWIPEDKYMIAWVIANYDNLMRNDMTLEEGFEWFETHRNNPFFVKKL